MKKVTAKPFNLSSIEEKLKKGIIQLRISKTASRHTNRTMANIRDRVGIKYKGTAHDSVCRGADYYKHEVYKLLTTTEFASFSVIRNLSIIAEESKIQTIGFFNIHQIVKQHKLKTIPKKEELFKEISKKHQISLTHFNPISIKSTIPLKELIKTIKKLNKNKKK